MEKKFEEYFETAQSYEQYFEARTTLEKFVKSVEHGPAQKSKEWYAIKAKTIGGSEIASVLNISGSFKDRKSLIAEKCGLGKPFNGSLATKWGTFFEEVTRRFTQYVLQMPEAIIETGSIEGVIERQRYSPDGLGIVKFLGTDTDDYFWFIVLFEFKSPYSTIPDGYIPKKYIPQILTGLLCIPIAELGIFTNNAYRRCRMDDINYGLTYVENSKKTETKQIFGVGIVLLYQTHEQYENYMKYYGYDSDYSDDEMDFTTITEYDMNIFVDSHNKLIDFGAVHTDILHAMFNLIEAKRLTSLYGPIIYNHNAVMSMSIVQTHNLNFGPTESNPRKVLKDWCNKAAQTLDKKYKIVGYLPYKIINSDIIQVCRNDDYLHVIKAPVEETLQTIDSITALPEEERFIAFNKLYNIQALEPEPESAEVEYETFDVMINYEEPII